jgi:serine/threonine protein kinase
MVVGGVRYNLLPDGSAVVDRLLEGEEITVPASIRLGATLHFVKVLFGFAGTQIRRIAIPASVEVINRGCFENCRNLNVVIFQVGSRLLDIGEAAFANTALRAIGLPGGVMSIGAGCFFGARDLATVIFERNAGLKSIGPGAFKGTAVARVQVPDSTVLAPDSFPPTTVIERTGLAPPPLPGVNPVSGMDGNVLPGVIGTAGKVGAPMTSGPINLSLAQVTSGKAMMPAEPEPPTVEEEPPTFPDDDDGPPKKGEPPKQEEPPMIEEPPVPVRKRAPSGPLNIKSAVLFNLDPYAKISSEEDRSGVAVYKDTRQKVNIAVKMLAPIGRSYENEQLEQFVKEVESLVRLRHPCVVAPKGCLLPTDTTGPQLVMEFLDGPSLKSTLAKPTADWWTPTQKAMTIVGIVYGMVYLHSRDIIHRRLCPQNILFDKEHHVKITDCAASRFYEFGIGTPNASQGMSLYSAPEMLEGTMRYTQKVDCYSFGWILYEIVVGNGVLSKEGQINAALLKVGKDDYPSIPASVMPVVKDLIHRCWIRESVDRPSFKEILKELEGAGYVVMQGVNKDQVKSYVDWVQDMIFA